VTGSASVTKVGSPVKATVNLAAGQSMQRGNIVLEIYDATENMIAQRTFENETISKGSPHKYSLTFTPDTAGRYVLKVMPTIATDQKISTKIINF
jgi:uncharacterized protein (DUF2141 family)